jgi:hypothetical protein
MGVLVPNQQAKRCKQCEKIKWYSAEDAYDVKCCDAYLNRSAVPVHAINAGFDFSNIQNDDKRPGYHNGIGEYIPSGKGKAYIEDRGRRKGLNVTFENDVRKMRGTPVNVPRRAR